VYANRRPAFFALQKPQVPLESSFVYESLDIRRRWWGVIAKLDFAHFLLVIIVWQPYADSRRGFCLAYHGVCTIIDDSNAVPLFINLLLITT